MLSFLKRFSPLKMAETSSGSDTLKLALQEDTEATASDDEHSRESVTDTWRSATLSPTTAPIDKSANREQTLVAPAAASAGEALGEDPPDERSDDEMHHDVSYSPPESLPPLFETVEANTDSLAAAEAASGPSAEQPDAHALPKKNDPDDKCAQGTAPSTQAGSPVSPDSLPPAPVPLTAAYGLQSDPALLGERLNFWKAYRRHAALREISFAPPPHLAYRPLDLFRLWRLVEDLGGYDAVCSGPPTRYIQDQLHKAVPWTDAWEKVYAGMGYAALPDSKPDRRALLRKLYEDYVLGVSQGLAADEGPIALTDYVRCICGHAHELPLPDGCSCSTCQSKAHAPMIRCYCCKARQHARCLADWGMFPEESAAGLEGTRDHLCEFCTTNTWRFPYDRKDMWLTKKKILAYEVPMKWVTQLIYRRQKSECDWYILRGVHLYFGKGYKGCIRSVTHLEEALRGEETDARAYGSSGEAQKRKWEQGGTARQKSSKALKADCKGEQELKVVVADLSNGLEKHPLPCLAFGELPAAFTYVAKYHFSDSMNKLALHSQYMRVQPCECESFCEPETCGCLAASGGAPAAYGSDGRLAHFDKDHIYECSPECGCAGKCGNDVVRGGVSVKLEVVQTSKKGYGVRAAEDIPKGTFVCVYVGEVIDEKAAQERAIFYDGQFGTSYLMDLVEANEDGEEGVVLDAYKFGNVARFINHSCEPNLHKQNVTANFRQSRYYEMALFASRDILKGEEISYDYGYTVDSVPGVHMTCYCGTPNCRGRVL